jgi:CheY-like chemotaxis protein
MLMGRAAARGGRRPGRARVDQRHVGRIRRAGERGESGQAALSLLFAQRPDVLIADLGMPGMDGYALIEQVRALEPDFGGLTPAVAVTAYASPQDRLRALQAGYQNHVAKPVEAEELAIVIASLAGRPAQDKRA